MAITEKERDSIRALVDASAETEEITRQIHECLKKPSHPSVERMKAIQLGLAEKDKDA